MERLLAAEEDVFQTGIHITKMHPVKTGPVLRETSNKVAGTKVGAW